ncbi:MAG TPA: CcmD family protein [Sandaracinaceae bacterium LLY-WYZ-13_1]|nr:CcmD family protein [Sandaracinaceae bacterium LLY-WYZ-13_1]
MMRTLARWLAPGALALGLCLGATGVAAGALAQDGAPEGEAGDAAEDRSMAFEAAEGPQTENIPGGALMIAAYGVVWLLVLGYVVSLGYRQASTTDDIDRLRRDLAAAEERTAED